MHTKINMKNKSLTATQHASWFLERLMEQHIRNIPSDNKNLMRLLESLSFIPYQCSLDKTIGITYIHVSVKKVTGFAMEVFMHNPYFLPARIHPEDKEQVKNKMTKLEEKGRLSLKYRWLIADGSYKWFSDYKQYVYDKKGNPSYIRGYWRKISEHQDPIHEYHYALRQLQGLK